MEVIDALFPRLCVQCEQEGSLFCDSCMADLSFDGPPFAYANPAIRQLICAWKYDGDSQGLEILRRLLLSRMMPVRQYARTRGVLGIVPVPLSSWKERCRGFHHAKQLASVVGDLLELPVLDVLERKHRWNSQANLSKEIRKESLKKGKVIGVRVGFDLPRSVMLVDDVETTGATLDAAEAALREAGVEIVVRWTLAKG